MAGAGDIPKVSSLTFLVVDPRGWPEYLQWPLHVTRTFLQHDDYVPRMRVPGEPQAAAMGPFSWEVLKRRLQ